MKSVDWLDLFRLEFYEGHDNLELVYDIRAPELAGKVLPVWLKDDPYAYDPVTFLSDLSDSLFGGE